MRRLIIILISIVMIVPSVVPNIVYADENKYQYCDIKIDVGDGVKTLKAIVDKKEIYIKANDFSQFTRYSYNQKEKVFLITGQEISKAIKFVRVDTNKKKICINQYKIMDLNDYYMVDEDIYLPICKMLPVLNADIYEIKDGVIYISNNKLSMAEVLYDFDITDYKFDMSKEFADSGALATGFVLPSYLLDTVVNFRFDRLDVVYHTGEYNDYCDIFSKYVSDNQVYMKLMEQDPNWRDNMSSELKQQSEMFRDFNDVFDWVEASGKTFVDKETGGVLLQFLQECDESEILKYDDMKGLTDAMNAGHVSLVDGLELIAYLYDYANLIEDNWKMLDAVYDFDIHISSTDAERRAAKHIYDVYGNDVANGIFEEARKEIVGLIADGILKPIEVYKLTAKLAGMYLDIFMPYDMGDISKLPLYCNTIISASNNYRLNGYFDDERVEELRLSLMMMLIASKSSYEIMGETSKNYGRDSSYYYKKIEKIEKMIAALYISGDNEKFDSYEHLVEFEKSNSEKIKKSGILSDVKAREYSKNFINQIENDIILSLLKETEVNVSGYKSMDLNGDGTEEIILSTRSEQNTQDSFYVIDKKSDTHIYEYTRFLAAGTNSLYVDEKNNGIYILQEYTTIGTQTQDIYKWNNGWEHIAHSEATEMNWHTFEWGQNTVSEEVWNAKFSEITKCTKWESNDISINSLEFEIGVNELLEQYKNYLKENKLEYITYEEDVDADGRAEKCIEVENYLWIYNKCVSSEFDTDLPNVFTYGLYQPVTKIVLSGGNSSCKVSILLDKNRFSTKSGYSNEKLKEYLVENIWYSYQPMLGDYYVYKFKKDGSFKLEMLDTNGITELYGKRKYTVANGKVTLEDDGGAVIWEYKNGLLKHTVYFNDDPIYGTYTLHERLVPSRNEIGIIDDNFVSYYNQFAED